MDATILVETYRNRLTPHRKHFREIAEKQAITVSWVQKFYAGKIQNPTVRSLEELDKGIRALESRIAA